MAPEQQRPSLAASPTPHALPTPPTAHYGLAPRTTHSGAALGGLWVRMGRSVVVSVATTAATTADYPDDKVTLPPAGTRRFQRTGDRGG